VRWSDTQEVTLVFPGPDAHIHHGPPQGPGGPGGAAGAGPGGSPAAGAQHTGDLGRRLAAERERQGLTREETARRAGMAAGYLAYLEDFPADPSPASLIRLAAALGTSLAALRGEGTDRPPGRGQALLHPQLKELDPDECRARLTTHGVGRIAVSTPEGPAVVPVNYEVVDDEIAFRTAPGSVPARAVGAEVAFEVDQVDEAKSQGWSVLAVGPARAVTEPAEARRLTDRAHTGPWAGGGRGMWVTLRPTRLTGRRITAPDQ
jgi:transcriptional regulator with XRE-family HTH domain